MSVFLWSLPYFFVIGLQSVIKGYHCARYHLAPRHKDYYHYTYQIGLAAMP